MDSTSSKSIAKKSIAELAPAALKDLAKEHNLKGTIRVFLKTKKFREINEGILKKPASELYLEWKSAIRAFLELRNKSQSRARPEFFRELSESFFRAYAVQSATEFWSPAVVAKSIVNAYSTKAQWHYEFWCYHNEIDPYAPAHDTAHIYPYGLSTYAPPLRVGYVPLDCGLGDLPYAGNKKVEHLKVHFRPLFELLLRAAKKGAREFERQMAVIENGNTDVQLAICMKEPFHSNMMRSELAYRAVLSSLPDDEKRTFEECVRLNGQFTIMNDLHGGFAMFNADLANKVIQDVLRYTDNKGRKEVESAGWCWRQIGTLYRLMEEDRLKKEIGNAK